MDVAGADAVANDRVEVRVLGPLRVRRVDGALVDPRAWRTGQTADLLRLLALHVDSPVPVGVLLDALWPAVDEARGRASLRTAASRIRKAVGADCVDRRLGGLVLHDAWVDAHAFQTLAREARRHALTGAPAKVVTATREAEPLYLSEVNWHTGAADWALREAGALAATYRQLIADAAEAAVTLRWWHDALDFAERSILMEPISELGYRAMMRAYRGLGESSRALQAYERCRHTLAEEIGADPSPATQALHLQLLTEEHVDRPTTAFAGRGEEVRWLAELAVGARARGGPVVACLVGPAGAGKTRLVEEVARQTGLQVRQAPTGPARPDGRAVTAGRATEPGRAEPGPDQALVVVDDAHLLGPERCAALSQDLLEVRDAVTVVLAGRPGAESNPIDRLGQDLADALGEPAHLLHLPPLGQEEVTALCSDLLQGEVCEDFTQAVLRESGGFPGPVIELVRGWASSGRVAATSEGLVVVQAHRSTELRAQMRHLLAEAVDNLSGEELDVLHLVAVLGTPVSPDGLLPLHVAGGALEPAAPTPAHRDWLHKVLDHLVDRNLLTATDGGFTTRDALLRDALLAWLRPSALRHLHRRIAELAHIPAADRIEHWRGAGEPQLAQAAALEASADAMSEGRYERARHLLKQLNHAIATADADPSDRFEVAERLGDVCSALGRAQEAQAAYGEAVDIARTHALSDLERMAAKLRGAADDTVTGAAGPDAAGAPAPAARVAVARDLPELGVAWDASPDPEVEQRLVAAVQHADEGADPDLRAELRTLLTTVVCVPRRQFRATHRWTTEALSLTVDPSLCAQALLARSLPGAVLGNGPAVDGPLLQAATLAGQAGDEATGAGVAALRCLVAHDLGDPDYSARLTLATELGAFAESSPHLWVLLRIAAERGELAAAEKIDLGASRSPLPPLVRQLCAMAAASLATELGLADEACSQLLQVLDIADQSGATLLVPEAAARLVVLEAAHDRASARERFELFEWAAGGDRLLPRENVLRHLARAAMRAGDARPEDAATAAAAAAEAAESAGLVLLGAEAHRHRAVHLSVAGRRAESRLAAAAAKRSYTQGSAPANVHRVEADIRRAQGSREPPPADIPEQAAPGGDLRLVRAMTQHRP